MTRKEEFSRDFGFRDQIQRATVSVMSNLAEGFERGGRAEFHQFVVIAKGLCAEVRSRLNVALDIGYISKEEFGQVNNLAIELSQELGGQRASIYKQKGSVK
ncbi:four helix bundle protein [Dissulfuribacter thermophilus]